MDIDVLREDSFKWQAIPDSWFVDRLGQLCSLLKDYSFDALKQRIDSYYNGDDRSFHRFPDIKDDRTVT